MKKSLLFLIRLLVALNLLYGAICYKFAGVPFSVQLFTTMSQAVHGIVCEPMFRIGVGVVETVGAILLLIPATARIGAGFVAAYMLVGPIASHVLILGYGWAFADAVVTFALPCLYLVLTRKRKID